MSKHVLDNFINPLRAMFGDPAGDDPVKAYGYYLRALEPFPAEVLEEANFRIVAKATRKTWPMVADCIATCEEVAHEWWKAEQSKRPTPANIGVDEPRDITHQQIIDALRGWPHVGAACSEGWISHAYDFVRKHRRCPVSPEVPKLRKDAKANEETINNLDLFGSLGLALKMAGETLMKRRASLAAEILNSETV